jgi:hypothetical protein
LLDVIDQCLKLNYLERPQSLFSLQKILRDQSAPPPATPLLSVLTRTLKRPLF